MTYEEKLSIIISALREAQKATRKEHYTSLYLTKDNRLTEIDPNELHDILLKLQDDEKVITIKDIPTKLKPVFEQTDDAFKGEKTYFLIDTLDSFDDWYASYLLKQKSKLKNLDWLNLLKTFDVCSDIDQQIQMTRNTLIAIPSFPYPYIGRFLELFPYDTIGTRKNYQKYRWEGAQYLLKQGVAIEVKSQVDDVLGYGNIVVRIDPIKFDDFYKAIKAEFEKRKQKTDKIDKENVKDTPKQEATKKTDEKDEPMYQITYTKQRQVLMNNAQIGKPDFNSENDLVFSFLYEHPNKRITREELEKAVGGKLTKTLHKIVENLGFEGDTKEVFFSVSKNAIEFRNPITKKDLEEMKKPLIKLVKGGGKLVIPH
ncbi:hypothetical protein COV86_03475 [Candidatus Roizmanbacteria bacterium CG11_big_fil_rev_8_21_14_0_20_35_14]|uniref:Uncharacterized protein n=1 Tax=Candidatus Roizmanbacteria bacterium CG11_big_fil_rev_8_21_14_0_20_35_14 TaxID=1974855 RepID=A0A2H0KM78_9BACT|nr:MAG: hypothetical protein COV86_03475 [Candidatus Roizmanbacteria bacterium CG11_big_fil_rev_8_21_14_0_20_35_14]